VASTASFFVVVSLTMTSPLVFHLWEAVQPQLEALVEKRRLLRDKEDEADETGCLCGPALWAGGEWGG